MVLQMNLLKLIVLKTTTKLRFFYVVIVKINMIMTTRFSYQKKFYEDLSYFNPRRIAEFKNKGLPGTALQKICSLIPTITKEKLLEDLVLLINL